MELTNEFTVAAPLERAWAVLTDVETIAPCLPGAKLDEIAGDEYRGKVKVKVGPITAQYQGVATFVERDETAKRVVLKGDGRDTRGQGTASALITAQLTASGDATTTVVVTTDLTITGKVAQFGRGVMADVSAKLMAQFADNLAALVDSASAEPDTAPEPVAGVQMAVADDRAPVAEVRRLDGPEPEAIDLLGTAGAPVAKRLLPALGGLALLVVLLRILLRRR